MNGFGELNFFRYCDEEVDALIRQTDVIVDPDERAAIYNQADELWLGAVPMIPMYQRPTLLAWDSVIQGRRQPIRDRPPSGTSLTGADKEEVNFGANMQPGSMNILEPDGNQIESIYIANAILEGAFTITPTSNTPPSRRERGADCQRRLRAPTTGRS